MVRAASMAKKSVKGNINHFVQLLTAHGQH